MLSDSVLFRATRDSARLGVFERLATRATRRLGQPCMLGSHTAAPRRCALARAHALESKACIRGEAHSLESKASISGEAHLRGK